MTRISHYIWLLIIGLVLAGTSCTKKEPIQSVQAEEESPAAIRQNKVTDNGPLNDVERLSRITMKVNRAIGNRYDVVFGDPMTANSPLLAVDYGLFGRLSDEGIAVMIANVILQKNNNTRNLPLSAQDRLLLDRQIGHCCALADYESSGFKEWAEQKNLISFKPDGKNMPSVQQRTQAFLEGYQKAKSDIRSKQSAMK